MKVSYSKILLSGIIASSFLMVSCQKKGLRGVKPQLAAGTANADQSKTKPQDGSTDIIQPKDQVKDQEKDKTDDQTSIPSSSDNTSTPSSSDNSTAATSTDTSDAENLKKAILEADQESQAEKTPDKSKDKTKDKTTDQAADKSKDKKEVKDKTADKEVKTAQQPEVKTQPAAEDKKVETQPAAKNTKAESKKPLTKDQCEVSIRAVGFGMQDQYLKITDMIKAKKPSAEEINKESVTFLNLCDDLNKFMALPETKACAVLDAGIMSEIVGTLNWNKNCQYLGSQVRDFSGQENKYSQAADKAKTESVDSLKKEKMVLSKDALSLLQKSNQNWNMFLVNGRLESDCAKLEEANKAKKVACTLVGPTADVDDKAKVTMSILEINKLQPENSSDEVQNGVDISVSMTIVSEGKSNVLMGTLACANLDADKVNVSALKAALGSQISSKNK